ncbi:Uma2 family endonuclease [Streptomyces avicenniae]|uniref:Uma2 family endonuclease n=1 Tax=Streptomyces avicenniae TaxID=500153 RepID=UPI00069B3CFA|nr:Uma2 family endonuclease [Streptomyces avicenniae]
MSVATVQQQDSEYGWDDLVRGWEELDAPEGYKAEIIEGIIALSPPPSMRHNHIASELHGQLFTALGREWGIYQTLGVAAPPRAGLYSPDLVVVPKTAVNTDGHYVMADMVELVVEITSPSSLRHDRVAKPAGYAAAAVPLYLLVDPFDAHGPLITLYGNPIADAYETLASVKFGETVSLPKPLGGVLETKDFALSDGRRRP